MADDPNITTGDDGMTTVTIDASPPTPWWVWALLAGAVYLMFAGDSREN